MSLTSKIKILPQFSARLLLMIIWLPVVAQFSMGYAADLKDLAPLVGQQDALLVSASNGNVLFTKHAGKRLIPASVLKLLTSLVALHYLGSDYRFVTDFYLDPYRNLKVKGYGDPLLISEVMPKIAAALSERLAGKHKKINDLVLDDSFFADPLVIPGVTSSYEPYDAPNGALCVNFNTVYFRRNNTGAYVSAEPQTPLLAFVNPRIQASRLNQGRIILTRKDNESALYTGHLLRYFMQQKGIQISGNIRMGRIQKSSDKLIFRYVSDFSLLQIISKLLEHSNNFIANQLLITAGTKTSGPPGTLAKGVRTASNYAANMLGITDATIVEGSGISRENRISAASLNKILKAFEPYYHLMQHDGRIFYKTGTLHGIQARAGYIKNDTGGLFRFVVLVNTPGKSVEGIMEKLRNALN